MSLRDKILYWDRHGRVCHAVNCMTKVISVRDLMLEKDFPEIRSSKSIVFVHRFTYQTGVVARFESNLSNLELTYNGNHLCIGLKCDCNDGFSCDCMDYNLRIMCKVIMTALDGVYPIQDRPLIAGNYTNEGVITENYSTYFLSSSAAVSAPAPVSAMPVAPAVSSAPSSAALDRKGETCQDFCEHCHAPDLLCRCYVPMLSKRAFLYQLRCFPLCNACLVFSRACECNFNILGLYAFYCSTARQYKVLRRMNEIKRIAYLAFCNRSVCFNCNKKAEYCICEKPYRVVYPKV